MFVSLNCIVGMIPSIYSSVSQKIRDVVESCTLRNNVFMQRKIPKNRLELTICHLLKKGHFRLSYFVLKY